MPIYMEISRLHRTVTIVARGKIEPDEIRGMAMKLAAEKVRSFAKILEVAGATTEFTLEQVVRLADEFGVEVQVEVQSARRLGVVDRAGHEEIRGIVVAFGFDEAGVEGGEFRVVRRQCAREDLKFLTTPAFDERAADEVVDDLQADALAHRVHEAGNPRAGMRLRERDAATFEQCEHEL